LHGHGADPEFRYLRNRRVLFQVGEAVAPLEKDLPISRDEDRDSWNITLRLLRR